MWGPAWPGPYIVPHIVPQGISVPLIAWNDFYPPNSRSSRFPEWEKVRKEGHWWLFFPVWTVTRIVWKETRSEGMFLFFWGGYVLASGWLRRARKDSRTVVETSVFEVAKGGFSDVFFWKRLWLFWGDRKRETVERNSDVLFFGGWKPFWIYLSIY